MNETYVAMISNTGGGVSYDTDPCVYRLLRYRFQNVPYDRPGRYVYLRDRDSDRYWSATWAPVHMPVDACRYTCRVGTGYSVIRMEYAGIRSEITYFVPPEGRLEIWDLTITNLSRATRRLSTFSYAEFAFWGAMRDLMNIDSCPSVSRQRHNLATRRAAVRLACCPTPFPRHAARSTITCVAPTATIPGLPRREAHLLGVAIGIGV